MRLSGLIVLTLSALGVFLVVVFSPIICGNSRCGRQGRFVMRKRIFIKLTCGNCTSLKTKGELVGAGLKVIASNEARPAYNEMAENTLGCNSPNWSTCCAVSQVTAPAWKGETFKQKIDDGSFPCLFPSNTLWRVHWLVASRVCKQTHDFKEFIRLYEVVAVLHVFRPQSPRLSFGTKRRRRRMSLRTKISLVIHAEAIRKFQWPD